ncbi:MAG: hypothetical protein GX640_02510 [Fibrobacter sp.]|nr:hypothetical protein [Fibrobacter sp.]
MAAQASEAMNEAYYRLIVKSQEPELREYYEAREMWIIDQAIREAEARKEGREEGIKETLNEIVLHMNESGISPESIVSITDLSQEEVRKIISDCRSSPRS